MIAALQFSLHKKLFSVSFTLRASRSALLQRIRSKLLRLHTLRRAYRPVNNPALGLFIKIGSIKMDFE